jgi:flagellar hook assembly protein FlgD
VDRYNGLYIIQNDGLTHIADGKQSNNPNQYSVKQNYPNPFNAETIIGYTLPLETVVDIRIYDLIGNEVVTLISERKRAGYYRVKWNGRDKDGMLMPSAAYLAKCRMGNQTFTRKLTLMK